MQRYLVLAVAVSAGCGSVSGDKQDAAVKQPDAAVDSRGIDGATCATSPSNLVGRWHGENSTVDASGNAYNGTEVGTNFSYTTGKHGMAFLFDGSTNEVSINDGDALWPAASFSVEAWVKTTSASGGQLVMKYQCAGSCPTNLSYAAYSLRIAQGGNPVWELRADGSPNISTITDTAHNIADGNWHYLVGVRDVPGAQAILYLDGAVAGTLTLPSANLAAMTNQDSETDNVTLGAGTVGGTNNITTQLAGALDEVSIYKTAMTAAQVQAIYSAPDGICN